MKLYIALLLCSIASSRAELYDTLLSGIKPLDLIKNPLDLIKVTTNVDTSVSGLFGFVSKIIQTLFDSLQRIIPLNKVIESLSGLTSGLAGTDAGSQRAAERYLDEVNKIIKECGLNPHVETMLTDVIHKASADPKVGKPKCHIPVIISED